jgi:hypothetical protein
MKLWQKEAIYVFLYLYQDTSTKKKRNKSIPFSHYSINDDDSSSGSDADYEPPKKSSKGSDTDDSSLVDSDDDEDNQIYESNSKASVKMAIIEIGTHLPQVHSIDRERVIKVTSGKRGRCSVEVKQKESGVINKRTNTKSAYDRVREFNMWAEEENGKKVEQGLAVKQFKLCCTICNIPDLKLKSSTIINHLTSGTHKDMLVLREKSQKTMLDFRTAVEKREVSGLNPAGGTLSLDVNAYRVKVCYAFLKEAIPMSVLNPKNEVRLLIEDGHATVPKQSVTDNIPLLNEMDMVKVIKDLDVADSFSISTDGTRNVADWLVVVSISSH